MTKSDSTLQDFAHELAMANMLDVHDDETHIAALERAGLVYAVYDKADYACPLVGYALTQDGKYAQRELDSVLTRKRVLDACNVARATARTMGVRITDLAKPDMREAHDFHQCV